MKQNQIKELEKLSLENLENIFNVYQDLDGMYFYNLLQTISIPPDLPESIYNKYPVVYGDTWPFISHKTLNNPNLWWLILMVNNIQDPTKKVEPGTIIRIPKPTFVAQVVSQIRRS
jgi:nucleoid-associated protein YgaU